MSDKKPTKAWELIAAPERWEQNGNLATDIEGRNLLHCDAPEAVKWCPYGAMIKIYGERVATNLLEKIEPHFPTGAIGPWNDDPDRKHFEVVELLKKYDI
jgi:hypothetical protein